MKNINENDPLLAELVIMSQILCPHEKVHHLIVDLGLEHFQTFPCPLVAKQKKKIKSQPSLSQNALVKPGQFAIQNCVFRSGQSVQLQKRFMRAGPRGTQYFNPELVRADIIALGKVTPGINNIIRQLVILLKQLYKVETVKGVKFSFKGYYDNNFVDLTPDQVETIHHYGGCFLGLSTTEFNPRKIVDNLVSRGVNQMYMIGGQNTLLSANQIYEEIKRRNLNIAVCVCLKAINKDIAIFDNCFGFESAVEQTQRFIEQGHAMSKSNFNSVVLIKVPGRYSGFLAMDAVKAARNANICLVPEFQYDFYGQKGLLKYIGDRIKHKGYCIIVYSDGASYSARDIEETLHQNINMRKEANQPFAFDLFLKHEIEAELNQRKITPNNVFLFDTMAAVRTVPANSLDTKLCCQISLCSIQGLMAGYTNFVIGHLKNRVAMVPIREMIQREDKFCLKEGEIDWLKMVSNTGQPNFLNDE